MLIRKRMLAVIGMVVAFVAGFGEMGRIVMAQTATPKTMPSAETLTFDFKNVSDNPVLQSGKAGQGDAVSVRFPQVVVNKGKYYLFYGTFQTMTDPVGIGYAQFCGENAEGDRERLAFPLPNPPHSEYRIERGTRNPRPVSGGGLAPCWAIESSRRRGRLRQASR